MLSDLASFAGLPRTPALARSSRLRIPVPLPRTLARWFPLIPKIFFLA
jgi:hypothetical protein